jgi:long-subunit acyl-CoA synthetase (AMP-forming)
MRRLEDALRKLADTERPLLEILGPGGDVARSLTYRQVTRAAQALADRLLAVKLRPEGAGSRAPRVGVVCGNTPAFIISDLACLLGRAIEVPVPLAFSRAQASSLLGEVDICLVDELGSKRLAEWGEDLLGQASAVLTVDVDALIAAGPESFSLAHPDEEWICKVIHTSGTTSRPKGVRIRARGLNALLTSLDQEMPAGAFRRYLCTVPLSLLIEQVTALYMVILHGGVLVLLPPEIPLVGTAIAAPSRVMPFLVASRPTALVATPALVDEIRQAGAAALRAGLPLNRTLFDTDAVPLICCGGAPIDPEVLRSLDEMGIPIYEGYGLSENGSVVSWNRPGARRIGTVGKPLPHVQVRLADDGELLVKSTSLFAGYTVDDPSSCVVDAEGWLHTGDLAQIDSEGFVRITGRKKNVIITSAGRNIAPEWVEAQYATLPFVRAVAVVGNHLPALHGLFLIDPAQELAEARSVISQFGQTHLSEVERVQVAHVLHGREDIYRRFFTVTGRPIRAAVEDAIRAESLEKAVA